MVEFLTVALCLTLFVINSVPARVVVTANMCVKQSTPAFLRNYPVSRPLLH